LIGFFGKIDIFRVSIDMRVVYESVLVEVNLYTWTFFWLYLPCISWKISILV